ncbi:hypothetical protein EDD86DRAFT_187599 [Gorgonomyces haynaldii]|nr:hypothetical protein EDD86DRAFT_187599 [Gorgonomyces haynaldii]
MDKLLEGLLQYTSKKTGNLLNHRPTPEADIAFSLIGEFIAEVDEFRQSVAKLSTTDLEHKLKLYRRCQPRSSPEQKEQCASLLGLLMRFPQFKDWKEWIKDEEHDDVERLIKDYPDKFQSPSMPARVNLLPPPSLYFDKNAERLAEMFGSNVTTGLKESQVSQLREHYGINKLPEPPKASIWKMLWKQLTDFMVLVLIIVGVVEAATDDVNTAIVLFVVVVFNVAIGVTQEYKANKALEALLTLSVPQASVIRDSKQMSINAQDLVPGDLVVLEEGDLVPADLRLCEVSQLEIVESILTGESVGVLKSIRTIRKRTRKLPLGDCKGNAFMTTTVARGRGKGIVVRTGLTTEIGKISAAIASAKETPSNVEKRLATIGKVLVVICLLLVILIVIISVVGYKKDLVAMIKLGISLGVSVIPEGLVAVVTVAIALGVARMAAKHAIVRKASAVETVGSVTFICSDKTGTLTEGKMGAQSIFTSDNATYDITFSTSLDPQKGEIVLKSFYPLQQAIQGQENKMLLDKPVQKQIDTMNGGLAFAMMVCKLCNNSMESFFNKFEKLGEYAFDSDRKLMSAIYKFETQNYVLCKGAPERVLAQCTRYLSQQGEQKTLDFIRECPSQPIDESFIEFISKKSAQMASGGLRVLALAVKTVSDPDEIIKAKKPSAAESDLIFVGLIGLIDPPKQGVKESVQICKDAGIKVVMITGDHVDTANAIAKQLRILDPDNPDENRSMKGYEVDLLSEDNLALQQPFPVVFARVSPDNKLKIVRALQKRKQVVVMTGDGVNDAPAIKQADVGVAMGKAGTEITRQAADIVLANDNFSTIVDAVQEGRMVYDNIIKFLVYLLSCNAAEVFLFIIVISCNLDAPLTSIQILWANIFADIPPAMSLGLEPAEFGLMRRKPRPTDEGVLTARNTTVIMYQSMVMTLLSFGIFYMAQTYGFAGFTTLPQEQALVFSVLTLMQLTQSFLSKSVDQSVFVTGITGNKYLVGSFFLSTFLLVAGVEIPKINDWLGLTGIGGVGWGIAIVCACIHVVAVEVFKLVLRQFQGRSKIDQPAIVQLGSIDNLP